MYCFTLLRAPLQWLTPKVHSSPLLREWRAAGVEGNRNEPPTRRGIITDSQKLRLKVLVQPAGEANLAGNRLATHRKLPRSSEIGLPPGNLLTSRVEELPHVGRVAFKPCSLPAEVTRWPLAQVLCEPGLVLNLFVKDGE